MANQAGGLLERGSRSRTIRGLHLFSTQGGFGAGRYSPTAADPLGARVKQLRMLDLFAGLGGASQAMRERGWFVVTVELEASLRPDVVADVRRSPIRGEWDLIWASPPCTEFARESMPWCRTGLVPDLGLVEASRAIIADLMPRWWVIENVRGAQRWLGPARWVRNPVYLWGQFPPFDCRIDFWKERLSSKRRQERAKMPRALSEALAISCESTFPFEATA